MDKIAVYKKLQEGEKIRFGRHLLRNGILFVLNWNRKKANKWVKEYSEIYLNKGLLIRKYIYIE